MNRLYYSNSALNSLNLARTYKNELMRLDRNLSALQAEIFVPKLKNELNLKLFILYIDMYYSSVIMYI